MSTHVTNKSDRDLYIINRARRNQENIVNVREASTCTSGVYIWTYRHTACDVISVITTTVPIKHGSMNDIKFHNKEMKRIRAPQKKSKLKNVSADIEGSPLEQGQVFDLEKARRKMSFLLKEEKKSFMSKLQTSRYIRTTVENTAAMIIQRFVRGYNTRFNSEKIKQMCLVSKRVRAFIRSKLETVEEFDRLALSSGSHRLQYGTSRSSATKVIQCAWRQALSRKALSRKRMDLYLLARHSAATVIQNMSRYKASRVKANLRRTRLRLALVKNSVCIIQRSIRCLIARRAVRRRRYRLRYVAAIMIQCAFRYKKAQKLIFLYREAVKAKKEYLGAVSFQGLIRRFIAKRRIIRMKLRRLFLKLNKAVSKIEALVRGFLSRVRVKILKKKKLETKCNLETTFAKEQEVRNKVIEKDLLDSVDLFMQAKLGNIIDVDDIFHGRISDAHHVTEIDANGDNLLTIAVALGNIEFVRKCIQWGFNINHRNILDLSPLMIACKNNHLDIVQYILLMSANAEKEENEEAEAEKVVVYEPLNPISKNDAAYILIAATEHADSVKSVGYTILKLLIVHGIGIEKFDETGMTAVHCACQLGHVDALELLYKKSSSVINLADVDEMGQNSLHKAATSSLTTLNIILGIDHRCGIVLEDHDRTTNLLQLDGDGKDCLLLANLSGKHDIASFIADYLHQFNIERIVADIGWTPNDVNKVILLLRKGDLKSLKFLIDAGIDPSWQEEDTLLSMSMIAAMIGRLDILELFLSKSPDLTVRDKKGWSIIHHAATFKDENIIPSLLTHKYAHACKLTVKSICELNEDNDTPIHIAAARNINISIDLLAKKEMDMAFKIRNNLGLTPLLIACSYINEKVIKSYLNQDADPNVLDLKGNNCIWHLYHPHISVVNAGRETIAGEWHARAPKSEKRIAANKSKTAHELSLAREHEAKQLSAEIELILTFVRLGCTFNKSQKDIELEELLALKSNPKLPWRSLEVNVHEVENCDIAIQEKSYALLKALVDVCSPRDLFRTVLSAFHFDKSGTSFQALMTGGVIEVLVNSHLHNEAVVLQSWINFHVLSKINVSTLSSLASVDNNDEEFSEYRPSSHHNTITTTSIDSPRSFTKSEADTIVTTYVNMKGLENKLFCGYTLLAWSVRLNNFKAFKKIINTSNGNSMMDNFGNTGLHFVSRYGTKEMLETLLRKSKGLRYEELNCFGRTPAMECAIASNYHCMKKLLSLGANLRRALDAKYYAWILVLARKRELQEKNLQTGKIGDDDNTWHTMGVLPYYLIHYSPN